MKSILVIGVLFLFILLSCQKNNDSCEYSFPYEPLDTNLFISFEINGNKYKYYQGNMAIGLAYSPIEIDSEQSIHIFKSNIGFGNTYSDTWDIFPKVNFTFWDFAKFDSSYPYDLWYTNLSNVLLETNYNYIYPPETPSISDTIFLHGVSLSVGIDGLSTQNVMNYYNYNIDSITEFFANNSYFNISSIENICSEYFLVKGTFAMETIYGVQPYEVYNIENGKFTFLTE